MCNLFFRQNESNQVVMSIIEQKLITEQQSILKKSIELYLKENNEEGLCCIDRIMSLVSTEKADQIFTMFEIREKIEAILKEQYNRKQIDQILFLHNFCLMMVSIVRKITIMINKHFKQNSEIKLNA